MFFIPGDKGEDYQTLFDNCLSKMYETENYSELCKQTVSSVKKTKQ